MNAAMMVRTGLNRDRRLRRVAAIRRGINVTASVMELSFHPVAVPRSNAQSSSVRLDGSLLKRHKATAEPSARAATKFSTIIEPVTS
jgi:hypothetical protein